MRIRLLAQTGALLLFCLALASSGMGCKCSEKLTDEQRLKKQLDTSSVHLYVATKVAVTKAGTDPEVKKAREQLLALIKATRAKQGADGEAPTGKRPHKLSFKELAGLVKAIWKLKKTGEQLVRAGKEDDLQPLLPILLAELKAPPSLIKATADKNTDHALFFFVTALLKMHPKSPVPIPPEVVLYEAWNTDAAALKLPGFATPMHSLKAWSYGTNDYCDLAEKESDAVDRLSYERAPLLDSIRLMSADPPTAFVDRLEQFDAAARAIAHAGVVLCHLKRGDDKKARPALKKMVAMMEKLGASPEELEYMHAVIDCGGDDSEVKKGLARIKRIEARTGAKKGDKEQLDALRAYCEASDETSGERTRKIALAGKLIRVVMHHAKKHGGDEALEKSPIFEAVGAFARVCEVTAKGSEGLSKSVEGLKGKAKGLLKKLKD